MNYLLVVLGVIIALFSIYMEINHKNIWNKSLDNYKDHKLSIINTLFRPSKLSYIINIYFIWPVFFILGLTCIYLSLN